MDVTVSPKVVTGRRIAWWRGVVEEPKLALYVFGSPIALVAVVIKLAFFHADMSGFGYLFYGAIAVVALVGCILLNMARDAQTLEADCPACGRRRLWTYTPRVDHPDPIGEKCRQCGAYAGVNGVEVRELSLDQIRAFEIEPEQWVPDMRRDSDKRITFDMPAFCAICGSEDATQSRDIVVHIRSGGGSGNGDELVRQISYARTGSRGRGLGNSTDPSAVDGDDLKHLRVPVCEQHAGESRTEPFWTNEDARISFASYRYYKAFCAANNVRPMSGKTFPSARARTR